MRKSLTHLSCLLLCLLAAACSKEAPKTAPESLTTGGGTGYANSAEALEALHAKQGVVFSTKRGWIIANDSADNAVWSFPPKDNPSYPAAVKRQFIKENGQFELKMTSNCEASPTACAELLHGFYKANDAVVQQLDTAR